MIEFFCDFNKEGIEGEWVLEDKYECLVCCDDEDDKGDKDEGEFLVEY